MKKTLKVCICITLILFVITNIDNFFLIYHIITHTEGTNITQAQPFNKEREFTTDVEKSNTKEYVSFSTEPECTIKDEYNVLSEEQKQYIEKIFYDYFGEVWQKYGYTTDMPIVTFVVNSDFIDDDTYAIQLGENTIVLREDIFEYGEEEVESVVIHELAHIAQNYSSMHSLFWLREGIADYITAQYCEYERSFIPEQYTQGELYDGYEITAGFLIWLENEKIKDIVMQLHKICQQGNMNYEVFETLTGQSLDELWKEYSGLDLPPIEQYLLDEEEDNFRIADYYYFGYGGEIDYQKAWQYYQKATEQNDGNASSAYIMLADMIQNNLIENVEIEQAIDYYEKAIAFEKENDIITSKTSFAMERIGTIYYNKEDPQAITWYEKAAEMGDVYSQNQLGDIYYEGTLAERDIQKAYFYFLDVVESDIDIYDGKVYAMETLGDICLEDNDEQAITWYEQASPYDPYSQIKLGEIYYYGTFGEKDREKARYYFEQVAENKDTLSGNREYAQEMLDIID